jgi:hypothetical protein
MRVKPLYLVLAILAIGLVAVPAMFLVYGQFRNPRIAQELRDDPTGERAQKVMLLSLPSGRAIPVNYLREGDRIYAGADGGWWRELAGEVVLVTALVKGESLEGRGRAILDDPAYTKDVFSRLRPTAVPGFGTLVEIRLDPSDPGGPRR